MSECAVKKLPTNQQSKVEAMANLVVYVVFQGARKTVRRLNSHKMSRNHLEILQQIDLTKSPAVDSEILRSLATAKEAKSLKAALEATGTDSTQFPALSVFATTSLLKDTKQFIEEWHRFLISVLKGAGKFSTIAQQDVREVCTNAVRIR